MHSLYEELPHPEIAEMKDKGSDIEETKDQHQSSSYVSPFARVKEKMSL